MASSFILNSYPGVVSGHFFFPPAAPSGLIVCPALMSPPVPYYLRCIYIRTVYIQLFPPPGASLSCAVELSPVHVFVLLFVLASRGFFEFWIFSLSRLPREGEFT